MNIKVIFMCVFGLLLGTGTVVWSQPFNGGPDGPGMHRPKVEEKMLMMLDLDDTQKTLAAEIVARYRNLERNLMEDNKGLHRRMTDALFAETFDEAAARETFRNNAAVHEDLMVLKGRMISEIRTILTPGQLGELQAMRARRMKAHARHAEFRALVEDSMAARK
ncbi:hypothetical protein DSCA_48940 [Desulfosarcina alkanivorans]|uniref:Periplasmic heavy metal sensor n=1 Tax=Desulfosarcina alkanivorans TaxID=571177 RepID=A0A5K7YXE4_9BACT|nr:Spy/CpxP family protein refolding chaperone [Desulfosarcina alkanivorans]BBO70964.1 hypothetical protein DSCA_48940 [Desulfosarcina alkanivorans]